jgi:AcrR family transcriptional regulator
MSEGEKDKRKAILQTALRLFVSRGFYGTPTSLISREAGVATGTLFFYFKTKEDLIDTLYREVKSEAGHAFRKGIEHEPSIEKKLRRVCLNYIEWGMKNPEKNQFMEQFAHSPFVSETALDEGMSNFDFLFGIVTEGISSGVLRSFSPELVFHMLVASGSGLISLILKTDDQEEQKIIIEQGLQLLWEGVGNT